MKILYLLVLILTLSYLSDIIAQERDIAEDNLLQTLSSQSNDFGETDGNLSIINQIGSENTGNVNQFQAEYGLNNLGNSSNLYQDGDLNQAIIYQYGNQISTNLVQQGFNNYADIEITGLNINGNITQDGQGNIIDQHISGQDFDYSILQDGNNNEFIQHENGITNDFDVSQVGNGITTIIISGPAIIK